MIVLAQRGGPFVRWDWIRDHMDEVGFRSMEHVQLTAVAVVVGIGISLPLAILAYRHRRLYPSIASIAGILYTIPSLALFAFLVPFTGLSFTTAEIGLVSYTLLILIRNIVSGLDSVPADTREAALGMGYRNGQLLWRVEFPLALPVIVAGIRIATVTTIGLVTVTSLLGMGGYGYFILLGLRRDFPTAIVLGTLLSVAFAVLVDRALILVERLLTPWANRRAAA